MIKLFSDLESLIQYIDGLNPYTPIDIFSRPDDNGLYHTYVAIGDYRATMADQMLYSGRSGDAKNSRIFDPNKFSTL